MESFSVTDFSSDARYAQAVARVRELEQRLIPKKAFLRMAEALSDAGVLDELRGTDYADALSIDVLGNGLDAAFERVADIRRRRSAELGIPAAILRIRDVWHGVGAVKKACRLSAAAAARGDQAAARSAPAAIDAHELPAPIEDALNRAAADFEQQQSRFRFDMLLDRAFSRYLREASQAVGIPFVRHFAWHLLDLQALLAAVRWRMWLDSDAASGERARRIDRPLLPVPGFLDADLIADAANDARERLPLLLQHTPYGAAMRAGVEHFQKDGSWAYLERLADDFMTDFCRQTRYTPFGIEPLVAYEWFIHQETRNVRLVVTARRAGVPANDIADRLREGYDA